MKHSKLEGKTINYPQLRGSAAGLKYPALVEIKYDGELDYIRVEEKDAYTINKYGTMRRDWPALNDIVDNVRASGVSSATMLCELYFGEGKLNDIYKLNSNKKDDGIKLKVFDIIELDGENTRMLPLVDRKELLHEIGITTGQQVKCWVASDDEDIKACFEAAKLAGFEGVVLKGLDTTYNVGPCCWVKMKGKDRSDYKVVTIDPGKERIEIEVPTIIGKAHHRVKVGCKAPNRYKKHISLGDLVTIEHQGVLPSGKLRHPVLIPKKEWK